MVCSWVGLVKVGGFYRVESLESDGKNLAHVVDYCAAELVVTACCKRSERSFICKKFPDLFHSKDDLLFLFVGMFGGLFVLLFQEKCIYFLEMSGFG